MLKTLPSVHSLQSYMLEYGPVWAAIAFLMGAQKAARNEMIQSLTDGQTQTSISY